MNCPSRDSPCDTRDGEKGTRGNKLKVLVFRKGPPSHTPTRHAHEGVYQHKTPVFYYTLIPPTTPLVSLYPPSGVKVAETVYLIQNYMLSGFYTSQESLWVTGVPHDKGSYRESEKETYGKS